MGIKQSSMGVTMLRGALLNNRRASAWIFLSLATCAVLVTLFATVAIEVQGKLGHALRALGANAVVYPVEGKGAWAAFDETMQQLGARSAQLVLHVELMEGKPVGVITADADRLAELTPYWKVDGVRPRNASEAMAGQRIARTLDWTLGQEIEWGGTQRRLVGLIESGDEDEDRVFISSGAPQAGGFRYALVSVEGGEPQIERLQQTLAAGGMGLEIKPLRQVLYGEQQVLTKVNVLFMATLIGVLVLTALGVSAAMLARVVERRKEFALLRALGARKIFITMFLLAESATMGLLASVGGFVVGTGLAMMVVAHIFQGGIAPHGGAFVLTLMITLGVALIADSLICIRTLPGLSAAELGGE